MREHFFRVPEKINRDHAGAGGVGAGERQVERILLRHGQGLPVQPERMVAVAMPAPTSSVPPVRLKMRIALGLRTKLRARAATSA